MTPAVPEIGGKPWADPAWFGWATGIEDTFITHVRPGLRRLDEYELTQHYSQWQADFDRVAATGARYLRWGIPWYQVQPTPKDWDWRWTDSALETLVAQKGITPVIDLIHYGTPAWLENSFINASYPQRAAEYAYRVAERYAGLVDLYTPLNEPSITSEMCGRQGAWPPHLIGHDGYVKVMLALARGITLTVRALQSALPGVTTVQVEAVWHNWTLDPRPEVQEEVEEGNQRQFLAFDLCTGRVGPHHPLLPFLRRYGVSDSELAWFSENPVAFDCFGANFYPWSYGEVRKKKSGGFYRPPRLTRGAALGEVLGTALRHTGLPVWVTETSANRDLRGRARWMDETVAVVMALRGAGQPVVGYTWFPLFTMFDWRYRTGRRPLSYYKIDLGLYDAEFGPDGGLHRQPTPLVAHFRAHTEQAVIPIKR